MERCEEETMERSEGETMLCADCLRVKKVVCVVCCMLYAVCCTHPILIYTSFVLSCFTSCFFSCFLS